MTQPQIGTPCRRAAFTALASGSPMSMMSATRFQYCAAGLCGSTQPWSNGAIACDG
ncbi:MAG: hypothetical protein OXC31_10200 [Spirochaetaceae bacterium]|nr:hypothetical protein [Spirochaetaceae bacterium]